MSGAPAEIVGGIIDRFERVNAVRDRALTEGRQIIRLSANAVRAIHRGELTDGRAIIESAREMLSALTALLADHPEIYWAGYVQDAMKELAEASFLLAIVRREALPSPDELGIEDAAYLNAMAEAASELRR